MRLELDFSATGTRESWANPWPLTCGVPQFVRLRIYEAPPGVGIEWFAHGSWEFIDGTPASTAEQPRIDFYETADGETTVVRPIRGNPDKSGSILAVYRPVESLDAAWAEAEGALPVGWALTHLMADPGSGGWAAFAEPPTGYEQEGDGPTPAAALRALAAKLRDPD